MPITDYNSISSWFDHTSPQYGSDGSGTMTRYDGGTGYSYNGHNGIDYGTGSAQGKDILAAADGTVKQVQWENPSNTSQGYGYFIRIYHSGYTNSTLYAHLTANSEQAGVSVNASVTRGTVIAKSGNTGDSTGPHLHFSVFNNDSWTTNNSIDPYGWSGTGSDPWTIDQGYLWTTSPPGTAPNSPPVQPGLTSPTNGATSGTHLVTFSWPATTDPDGDSPLYYQIVIKNGGGTVMYDSGDVASQLSYTYNFPSDGSYTWSVTASDGRGGRTASAVRGLTVSTIPTPNAPTGLTPSGGTKAYKTSPVLSWTDMMMDNGQPSASFTLNAWRSVRGTRGTQVLSNVAVTSGAAAAFPGAGDYQYEITAYNGLSGGSQRTATSASASFTVRDQFDYTLDGNSDILWNNRSTGAVTFWAMSGTSHSYSDAADPVTDLNWQVVGTPDYNRDGKPDILWQNRTTGSTTYWAMSGAAHTGSDAAATGISSDWKIVGTPDYNGDGHPDILWRNLSTGAETYWMMDGASHIGSDSVEAVTDLNWEIVGTPDYNGDGKTDILWRNKSTGSDTYWKMDGASHVDSFGINAVTDTNWKIAGTPDYNHDGDTDILWHNTSTGSNTYWSMGGTSYLGADTLDAVADTNWNVYAVH